MNGYLLVVVACHIASTLSYSPGAGTSIRQNDVYALAAARFAVGELGKGSGCEKALVLTSLVKGTQQVVAGTKYDLTVKVAQSPTCEETENYRPDMTTATYYNISVLHQPWKQEQHVLLHYKEVAVGDVEQQFQKFIKYYKKTYSHDSKEYEKRLAVFAENLDKIADIQAHEQGTAVYGATEFADISTKEFLSHHAMPRGILKPDPNMPTAPELSLDGLPESIDWRTEGVVTPVKNQGQCGSCWAFSVTGNVEGQWAIHHGKLISLSEQELVDCDKVDHGCEGGLPLNAYKQIMKLGGLESESEYPYRAEDMTCKFKISEVVAMVNGSVKISTNEDQMAAWLVDHGPISIGINAFAMQFYLGGISDPWSIFCNPDELDHGVLIVGYGKEGDKPFWIIKNSWGKSWGEEGYYRIIRGKGKCGLNKMATSAIVP